MRQRAPPRSVSPQPNVAPDKSRQHFDGVGARRTGQSNALRSEITRHVHCARISVIARHAQLGGEVKALPIGVNMQRRFCAGVADVILLRLFAVDGQANPYHRIKRAIALLQSLGHYIHGLLPATVVAVAHDALTNDIAGHFHCILTGREGLENLYDGRLRRIARLKIKAAERKDGKQRQAKSDRRGTAIEECSSGCCREKCHQPCERGTPKIIGSDNPNRERESCKKDGFLTAAVKPCTRGRWCAKMRSSPRTLSPVALPQILGRNGYKRSKSSAPIAGAQGHTSYCATPNRVYGSLSRMLSRVA